MRRLVLLFCLAVCGSFDLSFNEIGPAGKAGGWISIADEGYSTATTERCRSQNSSCVVVRYDGLTEPRDFGYVKKSFDATALRGKQVLFRGWLRVDDPAETRAQLFVRVDRANGEVGFHDYSHQRPIRSRDWAMREIVAKLDPDAVRITVGLMLGGRGAAYLAEPLLQIVESR